MRILLLDDARLPDKVAWKRRQNWIVRAPKLKTDEENKSRNNTEIPFLSVLLTQVPLIASNCILEGDELGFNHIADFSLEFTV